jgi:hypothetical protein
MAITPPDNPVEGPSAKLERALIDEFLTRRGHDPDALRHRTDSAARELLKEASLYASLKLTEVESRAHYVHDIRSTES